MLRLILLVALFVTGCARTHRDAAPLSSAAQPPSVTTCLRRLTSSPVEKSLGIPAAIGADVQSYRVPTAEDLASDGRRYSLHVNSSTGTAWITVTGGIADHLDEAVGPWSASHADVQRLVKLLSETAPE